MSTLDQPIANTPLIETPSRPDALAHLTATAAGRWLVPSLSDLFFIALFLWLFVAGGNGGHGLLADGDIGWHIRTGEFILDRGVVPKTDLFTFTKAGSPWFAWEWLSDVLFALAHRAAGLKAIVFIAGVAIVIWCLLLLRQALWRGANALAALAVTLLAVSAGSIHFLARPHVFTLLFTGIAVWLIESDRKALSWRVWLMVPMTALWANLHGGFVMAGALLGLAAAGSLLESSRPLAARYAILGALCGAASFLNPYGFQLHTHILQYLRSDWIRNVVQEFQAPNFRSENQTQYELLLIAGLMAAALFIARRRYVHALWLIVFAHLSLTTMRHIPLYATIAAPLLAELLTGLWSQAAERASRQSPVRILRRIALDLTPGFGRASLWVPVFVIGFAFLGKAANWPTDFPALRFPTALIHRNESRIANGRVLTLDQWADYLIYAFYPRQRVFADGRSDFLGQELGDEYIKVTQGDYNWRKILDRYCADTVLAPVSWPLATLLKSTSDWRIVEDGGQAILFTRRAILPACAPDSIVPAASRKTE